MESSRSWEERRTAPDRGHGGQVGGGGVRAPGQDGGLQVRPARLLSGPPGALSTHPGDDGGPQHQVQVQAVGPPLLGSLQRLVQSGVTTVI